MTRIIALTALATLGLSDAPVHEPVHGPGALSSRLATVRNIAKSARPTGPLPAVSANMTRSGKRLPAAGCTQVTVVPAGCRARVDHHHQQGLRRTRHRHFAGTHTCRRA